MSITLDTRQFDQALIQYAAASNKDFADISNRQTMNLAIQGLKLQKKAESDAIRALESRDFWPKIVAKTLYKKQGHYTRAQARKFSKALIRGRLKSVGFLRFFFAKMAQTVAPFTDRPPRSAKSFAGFKASISPATKAMPTTSLIVSYPYKRRSDKTARKAEAMLKRILPLAIAATVADMQKYINRKMGMTAQKYSAKGAR